jgi:hypothetical protein
MLADVQGLIATFTIDAGSQPTDTQATAIIAGISSEIDAILGSAGYAVPVTAPASFVGFLKLLNEFGAAAAILTSMFPGALEDPQNLADARSSAYWAARYKAGLDLLESGKVIPPDLLSGAVVAPSTYFTRNPMTEELLGDIAEPTFKRSQVF